MAAFPNLDSAAGLKKLDEHLLTRYYITSYKASKDDITVYAALSKPPPSQYVNVSRWYNHIETLLSISGISCEGSGVTIDGLTSITEEADTNSKDGVWVVVDDDNVQDVELIGEETKEEQKAAEERAVSLIASTNKKIIWESGVIIVMPNNGVADMEKLEEEVRSIQMEGLIWGSSKIVPVGYGVKFLRIIASTSINEQYDLADTLCVDHITSFGSSCVYYSVLQSLVLINPKDDEADIKKLEETVRSIKADGLFWGASKLVPIGYGIKLLGIECTMLGLLEMELRTIVKEKIMDSTYVQSCQTLMLNGICNGVTEEESDDKDDMANDDDGVFGEESVVSWKISSDKSSAGKSGLVFSELYSGNSDVKKLEESIRSLQTEGVVWGASKIVKVGYGIKFLRMVFTIVDDRLCFNTVIRNTGGIPLNRICKQSKILEGVDAKDDLFCINLGLNNQCRGWKRTPRGSFI